MNMGSLQFAAASQNVAFFKFESGSHLFKGRKVQVHRACANGTAARHGNTGFAKSCEQRTENQYGSTHGLDEIIGSFRIQRSGRNGYHTIGKFGRAAQ